MTQLVNSLSEAIYLLLKNLPFGLIRSVVILNVYRNNIKPVTWRGGLIVKSVFLLFLATTVSLSFAAPTTKYRLQTDSKTHTKNNIFFINTASVVYTDLNNFSKRTVDGSTQTFGFGIHKKWQQKFPTQLNAELLWSSAEQSVYHDIPNAFAAYQISESQQISLGRKKQKWSADDDIWERGLWEPRTYFQITDFRMQSLLGVHYNYENPQKHRAFLVASPVFIPDIGVKFDVVDNQFVANNPSFKPPSTVIQAGSTDISVSYDMVNDEPKDVIFHPLAAGKVSLKTSKAGRLGLMAAYKPLNQLVLEAPVINGVKDYGTLLHAKVRPEVYYHQLLSAQYTHDLTGQLKAGVVLTDDKPNLKNRSQLYLQKKLHHSQIYTLFMESFNDLTDTRLKMSYSVVDGGDAPDRGEFASSNNSRFPLRFHYTDALKLIFEQAMNVYVPLLFTSDLTYDFDQKVSLIKVGFDVNVLEGLFVSLQWRDISLWSNNYDKSKEHYWHGYIDADFAQLGVSYVF